MSNLNDKVAVVVQRESARALRKAWRLTEPR